jgi:hypothetical protein
MREVVAGTLLAVDDKTSAILGPAKKDQRGWGRWAGRQFIGSGHHSILDYHIYFPTYADSDHPGSAWQSQLALMAHIPIEDRQPDPWMQAIHDLLSQITEDIVSKSEAKMGNTRILITGDFNAKWVLNQDAKPHSRNKTAALHALADGLGLSIKNLRAPRQGNTPRVSREQALISHDVHYYVLIGI